MADTRYYTDVDGETWPLPDGDLEWQLRHTVPGRGNRSRAASILSAYTALITCSETKRRKVIRELQRIMMEGPARG